MTWSGWMIRSFCSLDSIIHWFVWLWDLSKASYLRQNICVINLQFVNSVTWSMTSVTLLNFNNSVVHLFNFWYQTGLTSLLPSTDFLRYIIDKSVLSGSDKETVSCLLLIWSQQSSNSCRLANLQWPWTLNDSSISVTKSHYKQVHLQKFTTRFCLCMTYAVSKVMLIVTVLWSWATVIWWPWLQFGVSR